MNTLNCILFYKLLVWGDAKVGIPRTTVGISSGKRNLEPCVEKKTGWREWRKMNRDGSESLD